MAAAAAAAAGGGGKAAPGLGVAADIRDSGMSVQQQLLQQQKFEDMDVALPLHWESMMRASRRRRACYNNAAAAAPPKLQELDNCNNNNNGMMMIHRRGGGGGQQEVLEQQECRAAAASCCKEQKSSSYPQQESFVVSRRMVTEPFSKMSPVTLARMFEPKYSKFCVNSTDFAPVELVTGGGLADSRSSSFRSQSSCSVILWGESSTPGEYGGRGDCCMTSSSSVDQSSSSSATSSRDSNGSSQDAYFDNCSTRLSTDSGQPPRSSHVDVSAAACAAVGAAAIKSCKDARPEAAAAGVLPSDVETAAFGAHGFMESERPAACRSWLRSPFKWKVPTFGGKLKMTTKAAAAAAAESSMDTHNHAKVQQEQQQKLQRPQRPRNVPGRISDMSYMDHAAALSKLQRTAAAAAASRHHHHHHHHHHPCTDCCLVDAAAPRSAVAPPRHSYSHESSSSSAAATSSCKVLPGASSGAAAGSFSSPPPAREFVMRRSSECYNDKAASSSPAAECAPQLRRRSVSSTLHAAAGHFDRGCSSSSRSDNYVQQQAAGGERERDHRVEKAAAADTGSLSKARERWLKCMKLLKLPYGRSATERLAAAAATGPPAAAAPLPQQSSSSVCKMQDQLLQHRPSCSSTPGAAATPLTRISISSSADNNNAMRARPSFDEKLMRPARPPSVDANKPMRSKSMPAAFDRTAPSSSSSLSSSRPKSHVVSAAPGLAGCGSLSSHSPRFPTTNNNIAVCENNTRSSSKMSMNQLPAVQMNNRASAAAAASAGGGVASSSPKVKSSPKFSCRRSVSPNIRNNHSPKIINSATPASIMNNNNNNSQMSELHSAVQGAIAHCKRSHTSTTSSSQHQSHTTASS